MDGVLIDSHPVHKKAWTRLLASINRPVSEEELDFVLEGRKREEILRHFLGDLSPEQVKEYGRLKNELYKESEGELKVVSGLVEFLDALQAVNIRMAVATSASSPRAHDILEILGLLPRFAAVVTANDVERGKPDPEIFVRAANQLSIVPGNLLVVEDAVSGVKGAKSAGMKCIGIASGRRKEMLKEAGADAVIPDYWNFGLPDVRRLF